MSASPFSQQANDSQGEDFEMPEAGLHPATVVGLVDLGTQTNEYQGNVTEARKLFVAWELETKDSDHKPFVVGQEFTASLGKKANWRKILEGWRGRPFADKEEFDPVKLVGAKCIVTIQHGITTKKKEYAKVVAVAMPMKGQTISDPVYSPYVFHLGMVNSTTAPIDIPEWMPRNYGELLLDCLHESKEWKAMKEREFSTTAPPNGANGQSRVQDRHENPIETAKQMAAASAEREECPF